VRKRLLLLCPVNKNNGCCLNLRKQFCNDIHHFVQGVIQRQLCSKTFETLYRVSSFFWFVLSYGREDPAFFTRFFGEADRLQKRLCQSHRASPIPMTSFQWQSAPFFHFPFGFRREVFTGEKGTVLALQICHEIPVRLFTILRCCRDTVLSLRTISFSKARPMVLTPSLS